MSEYYLIWFYTLSAVFGLCIGSFLNVVIYRVPNGMSVVAPPSHCPKCGTQLKAIDNIPVLSYVFLHGKCRYCGTKISLRYTVVELLNAVLWLACALLFADNGVLYAAVMMAACSVLICVCFIDLENMWIPDRFHLILLALGITLTIAGNLSLKHGIIGMAVGGGFFLLMQLGSRAVLKREGLGGGDVKLMAAAGFLLGWKGVIMATLIASLSGSIVLVALERKNKGDSRSYPFAPFLAFGILFALMFGDAIINWYIGLF